MLYYSTGDQAGNWLANHCKPSRAQVLPTTEEISAKDWSSYTGKNRRASTTILNAAEYQDGEIHFWLPR
jgi:hypothetical protein